MSPAPLMPWGCLCRDANLVSDRHTEDALVEQPTVNFIIGEGTVMPQDRDSGARAARFGKEIARRIARSLGATMLGEGSNRCQYSGRAAVIKTARTKTNDIGVTYRMLGELDIIIAALETDEGGYDLFEFDPGDFRANMRDSITGRGNVGLVRRSVIVEKGVFLDRYSDHQGAEEEGP